LPHTAAGPKLKSQSQRLNTQKFLQKNLLESELAQGDPMAQRHAEAVEALEKRRRAVVGKLDRGYEDFVSGDISDELWKRKSTEWEADLSATETELTRIQHPCQPMMVTAERILELAQKAEFLYKSQDRAEQRRLLEIVLSNCTFDRGSLTPTYNSPFDLLVKGNKSGNWRRGWDSNPRALADKTLSRRPRYDHFGTSPQRRVA
jgi:hypothetical protein